MGVLRAHTHTHTHTHISIDSGGMWLRTPSPANVGPALYKGTFNILGEPKDTFADMEVGGGGWSYRGGGWGYRVVVGGDG